MQVPLTGHLRALPSVGERPFGIVAGPSFTHSWPPLSVNERIAVAVAPALACSALLWGVIAAHGYSEPQASVSRCVQLGSDGPWSTDVVDVDGDGFIAACTRRSGN